MNVDKKIQGKLKEKSLKSRFMAVVLVLSFLFSGILPYANILSGVAITENDMLGDNLTGRIKGVQLSLDAIEFGNQIDAGNVEKANIWLQVEYDFNKDNHTTISKDQPYFYFIVSNDQVELLNSFTNMKTSDSAPGWKEWKSEHKLSSQYPPATYDVHQADDGQFYIQIKLSDEYIDYIDNGNKEVQGMVKFCADIDRGETQDGDREFKVGDSKLTVKFDDKIPTLDKSGAVTGTDSANGSPIITWTITVNNFYELSKFELTDTHLSNLIGGSLSARDAEGNAMGIHNDGNKFVFDDKSTSSNSITITYQTVATEAEMNNTTGGHRGFATNTVSLNYDGTPDATGEVDLNVDSKAHLNKTYKPSYEVTGEKGFIYWTLTVNRDYHKSLDGYVIKDSIAGAEFVSVENASLSGSGSESDPWIISNHTGGDTVKIVYKTPVTKNSNTSVTNGATITPPGSTTKDDEKIITGYYNDKDLFSVSKNGTFNEETEKINWTITISAVKNNSLETLNGYTITDAAFGRNDIENLTVRATNNGASVYSGDSLSAIASGSGTTYTVKSIEEFKEVDYIEISYTVPLTDTEQRDRNNLTTGNTMTATNDVAVNPDDGTPGITRRGESSVGSNSIGITAQKNWNGYFALSDRTYPVTLILQRKLAGDADWESLPANEYNRTINSASEEQKVSWESLPKKVDGKIATYRVIEQTDENADYTVGYSNDYGVTTDATLTITNTWNKMAVSVNKIWNNDTGHENERPDVTMHLYKSTDWGVNWVDTGKYAKIVNGVTKYYDEKGNVLQTSGWSSLDKDKNNGTCYKIVEDPVPGYDISYSGNINETGTINVTNTANSFNLSAEKVWDDGGDSTTDREEIKFDLYQSYDQIEWTKIADKTQTLSTKKNEIVTWNWLPGKDSDGRTIYYKVQEQTVPANYKVSYSNETGVTGGSGNQKITVTNKWEKMNVSVEKRWDNVDGDKQPDKVTVELWRKVEGSTWKKMTEVDSEFSPATVEVKKSDGWKCNNAWVGLPKTVEVNGQAVRVYYAAREVNPSPDFIQIYDTVGISGGSGTSYITNKSAKIKITANKEWSNSTATLPRELTFHLESSINGGSSWEEVADSTRTLHDTDWNETLEWPDLPIQSNGAEVLYKVVEDTSLDDFSTSYSPETISGADGRITVKNQQKARYSKFAINLANAALTKDDGSYYGSAWYGQSAELISLANAAKTKVATNQTDRITYEQLAKASNIEQVDINGVPTECYIFRWYADISKTSNVDFIDTLPDDSIYYISNKYVSFAWMDASAESWGATNEYNWEQFFNYNEGTNQLTINGSKQIKTFSYCIAIPKSSVDKEIEENGEYVLKNKIRAKNETEDIEAELKITNEADTGTITKANTNDGSTTKPDSKGMSIGDARAYYTVDVNPDAKYLSNGDSVTVTDIFKVLKYLNRGGEIVEGYDIVNADLENVVVYEVDNATGKSTPLTGGYSYINSKENSVIESFDDLTSAYTLDGFQAGNNGKVRIFSAEVWPKYEKGTAVVLRIDGTSGAKVEPIQIDVGDVTVEAIDKNYNSEGYAKVKVYFNEDYDPTKNGADLFTANNASTLSWGTKYDVISIGKTKSIEATQYITNFTIPDGKHIKIEYEYLITNTDGSPIGRNLSLWLENDSIVHTSAGDETSTAAEEKYSVTEILSDITTGGVSKLIKVDVGNYSVKNLEAEFILAKFDVDTGQWIYATEFPYSLYKNSYGEFVESTTDHTISFEGALSETALNGMIPSEAQAARIRMNHTFNLSFDNDTLYKLIELKAPNGYFPTGYVEGKTKVSDLQLFTSYFTYVYENSAVSDGTKEAAGIPAGTNITMLNDLGSLEIPNTKPITVGAKKIWEQDPASSVNNPSVTVELWKSYLQSKSGVPDENADMSKGAVKVENAEKYFTSEIRNAANMTTSYGRGNVDGTFTITRQGSDPYTWNADAIWENLPNGEKGKAIYYYVKEVAYTIGGKTYTLDTNKDSPTYDKFVDGDGEVYTDAEDIRGEYRPTYANNAINENGTVTISNSRRFVVKKIWMRSDGTIMKNPPDRDIKIKLEGYVESSGEWKEIILGNNNVLNDDHDWLLEISQSYVSAYSKFRVSEIDPPYNYTISTIYELDGTVGTVSLVNKSKAPSTASLNVTKKWGDNTSHDSIDIVLYQATSGIEPSALAEMSKNGTLPSNAEDINLKIVDMEGIDSSVTLDADNEWTYTWDNLPYADDYENRIYYYAVETAVPEGYTVTYEKNHNTADQVEIITNSIQGGLALNKNWVDTEGEPVTVNSGNTINLDIYRTIVEAPAEEGDTTDTPDTEPNTDETPSTLKIMPMGDSITFGYKGGNDGSTFGGYRKYLYNKLTNTYHYDVEMVGSYVRFEKIDSLDKVMINDAKSDGTGESIAYDGRHESQSGKTIEDLKGIIQTNKSVKTYKPDVILLMIGTNDVLYKYTASTESALYDHYKALVDEIYEQYNSKEMKLFLITPPRIDSSTVYDNYPPQTTADTELDYLKKAMDRIARERTDAEYYCKVIDVYSALYGKDNYTQYLADYTHPNDDGYEAIGNYLADYLATGQAATNPEENEPEERYEIAEINDPNELSLKVSSGEFEHVKTIPIQSDGNGNWSTVEKDLPLHPDDNPNAVYVYYVVEQNGDSYSVVYSGNGKVLSETESVGINLTNTKEFEPIDITVEKVWPDKSDLPDGAEIPTSVSITLYSAQTPTDNEEKWTEEETISLTGTDWTYTFEGLNGSKYWYVKEDAPGWTATYDGNGITLENGTITITNTLDTGNIEVNKQWYKDENGGNKSVDIKVYRVAYNDDGSPIYEYQPRMASTSGAYSLSRVRRALAMASQNSDSSSGALDSVSLTLGDAGEVRILASRPKTETFTDIDKDFELISGVYWINLYEKLGECTITDVTVISKLNDWGQPEDGTIVADPIYPNRYGEYSNKKNYGSGAICNIEKEISSSSKYIYIEPWYGGLTSVAITYTLASEPFELVSAPSSLVAGDTGTITATGNNDPINWSSSDESKATVDSNGVITALSAGTVTITGVDGTDSTRTVSKEITINAFQINNGAESVTLNEGDTPKLSTNNKTGKVSWSSDNRAVKVDSSGTLEYVSYTNDTVTITAEHLDADGHSFDPQITDTITVNMQAKGLELSIDKNTLHINGTAKLTVSPADGVNYNITGDAGVEIDKDGTVTALSAGTVEIIAHRNGKDSLPVTLNIGELGLDPTGGTYNLGSDIVIKPLNVVDGIESVTSSDDTVIKVKSISDNAIVLEAVDEGQDITITVRDGAGGTATATFSVDIQKEEVERPNIPEDKLGWLWSTTISPNADTSWTAALTDLPLTDGKGHTYTYYIEEILEDGKSNYYPIHYSDIDGFELEKGETQHLTVINKSTETDDQSSELPESGGQGTKIYYTVGCILLLLSAAGYVTIKRRRWLSE